MVKLIYPLVCLKQILTMKTKLLFILSLIFFSYTVSNAQTVDDIIVSHLKATGGVEKWASINSMKMTGNIDIAPGMKAPFIMYFKDKNKFRFELEVQGLTMIQALDVDSGWSIIPFSGKTDPERMSPEEIKSSKQQADFTGDLYNYKQKENLVEYLGTEDMEGTETLKLKVTRKNNDITYMYLDAESYLTLKETSKVMMQDKEIESVTLPSNYKDVEGLKFAFSMELRGSDEASGGQTMNIETLELNPKVSDELFKMPAVTPAVQPASED